MKFTGSRPWMGGVLAVGLLVGGTAAAQTQQGTLSGRVTEEGSGEPIPQVQVVVVGTNLGALTNNEGRYTIRNAPSGPLQVRALRIGYQELKKPVTVAGGTATTLDFALPKAVIRLEEIVTTATGPARRVELGNAISNIDVATVATTAPVSTIADLLNSRAPGVQVMTGSQTGAGSRVRIRGSGSLNLSNDPIYIIDGVRLTSNSGSTNNFTGGATPSRVGDINPQEIENIEIVKGPSAATLYGTDAANGVIVITTKRGRAGAAKWDAFAEGGVLADRSTYPNNYTIAGHSPGSTTYRECGLPLVSAGSCIKDSVRVLNIFDDKDISPLGTGYRNQFGLQVSGGSEAVRYFLAGERESETGVLQLPPFERRRLDSTATPIRDWTDRPNALGKLTFRANVDAAINPKLDVRVSTSYIDLNQRLATESNATAGIGSQIYGGPGYKSNGTVSGQGTPLNGYRAWTPGYTFQEKNSQIINRFIGSASANWRPTSWLAGRANVGTDYTNRVDDNLLFRGEGPPLTSLYRLGFKTNSRTNLRTFSADLGGTATWQAREWLNSKTTIGAQYVDYRFDLGNAGGTDLPAGTQTAGAAAVPNSAEATTLQKTLGLFVEEAVALRDRLFLTGALRTDQNSAFGTDFQSVIYPKASLSWLISEESFFPRYRWLNQLRLRSAYGASGVQPGSNDALRAFQSSSFNLRATDAAGIIYTSIGNSDLKPEKTTEFEAGIESRMFSSRVNVELTHYRKRTKDALISAVVVPSAGAAATVRRNLGAVQNLGWELLINSQLVDRPGVGFDLTLSGSTNSNKLISLGNVPPQIGTTTRAQAGYPLFGYWARKISSYSDKNKDGILTYNADPNLNEVVVDDSSTFVGYSLPRYTATLTAGLDLFKRRLRISSLVDYRGGHYIYNNTERIRCVSRQNCNGLMNPNASFEEQAMVVATRDHPAQTLAGFFQKGDFVRLREMSATLSLPDAFARRFLKARSTALTVTARNLGFITKYRGIDPEIDSTAGDSSNSPTDFQTLSVPTYLIFRLNVGF